MDQPQDADPAACPAGSEVLQPVPLRERSPVAGEKTEDVAQYKIRTCSAAAVLGGAAGCFVI